jgi:hypothetical protein
VLPNKTPTIIAALDACPRQANWLSLAKKQHRKGKALKRQGTTAQKAFD